MNETIQLLLSLSLSGSILAVLIFAIKPLIRHKLSKSIQYYIWIVVLLRLILPFSFDESIMNKVFYGNQTALITSSQGEESANTPSIFPNVQENISNGTYNSDTDHSRYFSDLFKQYVLYIWLLGVIIAITANITGYTRFLKYLKQANRPATDEESKMLTSLLNGRKNVRLVRNPFAATPILIGILRPLIIIPDIGFSEKQLKNILLHEIAHFKRFDIGIKWLTMIAASLHWFNPLVYFIKREINHACELSCDEAVIKNFNAKEKQDYGDTLISVVSENKYPLGVLQATMSEEKVTLKDRLLAIMKYSKKSRVMVLMSIVLLFAVISGAVMLGGCSGKTNPVVTNTEISTSTKIDDLLSRIMSSPKESSNPKDYINAHQEEYDAIIKMDLEALPYLFSEFEKGGQTGLNGYIMESLCRNILGSEDIKYLSADPQDWYDTYKAHMHSMLEKNTYDFVKKSYPKGSIVLNGMDLNKENFYKSVNYDPGKDLLSFTIPKTIPEGYKFYLHVSGRMFMGDKSNGMSFHAFDEENQNYSWVNGKTYTYSLKSENLDECMLVFGLIDKNNQELLYTIHISPDGTKSIDNTGQLLCFIKVYDEKIRMLTFDEIEWVVKTDTKRVNELGLDAELDFPNGYYIHNESVQENSLKVSDDVKVYIINWSDLANPLLTDVNGLTKRMAEYPAPYHLTIKDGLIVEILEQYRP